MSEPEERPKEKTVVLTAESLTAGPPVLGTPILIPLSPEQAAEFIEQKLRPHFEDGGNRALLEAVDICARAGIPMPGWVAGAFSSRFTSWRRLHIRTLDEAFQVAWPKGTRWGNRAARERKKGDVMDRVCALRKKGPTIDEELFAAVGSELGIGGSLASKIYYDSANRVDREYFEILYGLTDT